MSTRTNDDPAAAPTIQELAAQWENALEQFRSLRSAVEHATRLAQAKEQADLLARERDVAFKSLGEAVWEEVQKRGLQLPRALGTRLKNVEALDKRKAAQSAEISALLAEGETAAARVQRSKPPPVRQVPLARPPKKR